MKIRVKDNVVWLDGKKLGVLKNSTFVAIKNHKHLYYSMNSLGFEEKLLKFLKSIGVTNIKIKFYDESRRVEWFITPLEIWFTKGRELKWLGEVQYHLTLRELREITKAYVTKAPLVG